MTPEARERKNAARRVGVRRIVTCLDCETTFSPPKPVGQLPKRCTDCAATSLRAARQEAGARWRAAHPEKYRENVARSTAKRNLNRAAFNANQRKWRLARVYGLTADRFDALLLSQGGGCAICGGGPDGDREHLCVDHDHTTGVVRGLLCSKCNLAVGLLGDTASAVERAAAYMRGVTRQQEAS